MNYMDFHCHLDMEAFDNSRRDIVNEYFESGFSKLVVVADPYEARSLAVTREILDYHDHIYTMAAAHPHNADQYSQEIEKGLVDFLEQSGAVALGEAGLDFHYDFSSPENQLKVFKRQINLAKDMELPLVIHSRKAEPLVLKALEDEKYHLPVVFHCYTGSMEDAREILTRGYSISISGIVTFKKSPDIRDIAEMIPLDRLFTETDSPYLSPEPYRNQKPNTPLLVKVTADRIAELKGIDVALLNEAVNANFQRIFLGS